MESLGRFVSAKTYHLKDVLCCYSLISSKKLCDIPLIKAVGVGGKRSLSGYLTTAMLDSRHHSINYDSFMIAKRTISLWK